MFPRVIGVRHVEDYQLEIHFSDGTVAELDFRRRVVERGGVFGPLGNVDFFKQVTVDREAGTSVWPNGVDLCPDVPLRRGHGKVHRRNGYAGGSGVT